MSNVVNSTDPNRMTAKHWVIQRRESYIRHLLSLGWYENKILDKCQDNPLFWSSIPRLHWKTGTRSKVMARGTIQQYIGKVKRDLVDTMPDGKDEVVNAYERLLAAFRLAVRNGDSKGMVLAQREINRMLGIRGPSTTMEDFSVDKVRQQMSAMMESVGGTEPMQPEDPKPKRGRPKK